MIKQLVHFAQAVRDEDLRAYRRPLTGLHVRMSIVTDEAGRQTLDEQGATIAYYNGKAEPDEFIEWTKDVVESSWMIGTNKCFDLPEKGVHSASPYCVAMKRDSLPGGEKYKKDKRKITARFAPYFAKAFEFVEEEPRPRLELWSRFFTEEGRLEAFLKGLGDVYGSVQQQEYVAFYLEASQETYKAAHTQYLQKNLFNTAAYTIDHPDEPGEQLGTSDFANGFNTKKPFLEHQSATFSITGRISGAEALGLHRFQQLLKYKVFPNPLPIFVHEDEREALSQQFNHIITLQFDGENRPSHSAVMKAMLDVSKTKEIGNYYLLYHNAIGAILDFDFVPKFEYALRDGKGRPWEIHTVVGKPEPAKILDNVFDFQEEVLVLLFNNSLVVRRKDKPLLYNWFGEPATKDATNQYLVYTFRGAFYDFIYKSRRSAVSHTLFHRLMKATILADIRADTVKDGKHSHEWPLHQKLNVWFSLYYHFISSPQINANMVNQLKSLQEFTRSLVDKENPNPPDITDGSQFAFVCGQLIAYIFTKISSDKQSHDKLERFLNARTGDKLKLEIAKLFERYKHGNYSREFGIAMSQVMACSVGALEDEALPFLLAGYFSNIELFSKGKKTSEEQ